MITNALILPAGAGVKPEEIFLDEVTMNDTICSIVGCDATNLGFYTEGDDEVCFHGFVNRQPAYEELAYNYLATALLNRPVYGDAVITWALDDDGVTEDPVDIPSPVVEYINGPFLSHVAETYNVSVAMSILFEMAIEHKVVTPADGRFISRVLPLATSGEAGPDDVDRLNDIMERVNKWGETLDDLALMRFIVERADAEGK